MGEVNQSHLAEVNWVEEPSADVNLTIQFQGGEGAQCPPGLLAKVTVLEGLGLAWITKCIWPPTLSA